jgi:hypothetical protein
MSDARWFDVEEDVKSAVGHFSKSVQIFELGGFDGNDLPAYIARMALMQSMQAGYTSLGSAFERILEMIGEEKPAGANYHADLLRRVSRDIPDSRPAIIDGELAEAADEARRFRHVARKSYDGFHVEGAASAVKAAALIRDRVAMAIGVFRSKIESQDSDP